jgi:hypothetical protein
VTLHILHAPPPPKLARALADFEAQFTYPLGPGRTFRISHGDDYPRFFRAQGDGACFVLENDGQIAGALGVAVRLLLLPNGEEHTVAYVGDLKVDPAARRSLAYLRLAFAAHTWVGGRTEAGYGVVMDGTAVTPDTYTGQLGIPAARVLGRLVIWQFRCPAGSPPVDPDRFLSTDGAVLACYRDLNRGRYAAVGARPEERSEMPPTWLLHPDGLACGLVEDTRRAKRLIADSGEELRSAHLSFFGWRAPTAVRQLFDVALAHAARWGHPALFVAAARQDADSLRAVLDGLDRVEATATVYGSGLDEGPAWHINTAEI